MDAKAASALLEPFTLGLPGIAIGNEIFTYLVKQSVDLANSRPSIVYPTTTNFGGMPLQFTASIDSTSMKVELDRQPSPPPNFDEPLLRIKEIYFDLTVLVGTTIFSVHRLKYKEIIGGIGVNTGKITLNGKRSIGTIDPINEPWKTMTTLPDGTPFDADRKAEWMVNERAVTIIAKDTIGPKLLESIHLPDVLKMIVGFQFVGPIRIGGAVDLIMFAGPASWVETCSRVSASAVDVVVKTKKLSGADAMTGTGPQTDQPPFNPIVVEPGDTSDYPHQELPRLGAADLFIHLPRKFVETRFDGVIKPGAGYADSGYFGPIYWHYETALLNQSIALSLVQLWPMEFLLEVPARALGGCGAGVKIGCVYFEAAGVSYYGDISPFEVFFALGQDTNAGELYFASKLGAVVAHDFGFHHWPLVDKFPVDQIADFILAQAAQAAVTSKAGEILNVSRFSLIDLGLLRPFGQMKSGLSAATSAQKDSVTIGVAFTF